MRMDVSVPERKYSESGNTSETCERKHKKLRGKDRRKIKEQMEFYFSPANLRRDRFLGNLVRSSPDGYVHMDIFLTFNGIQKFTNDINDIIKAVAESSQLEVDPKGYKIRAKSQEEKKENSNYDDCTIYVERLPQNADHHFVRNIFNRFGNIAYVSLPKFKNCEKIKGFAFVEFEKSESVELACQAYKFDNDSEMESEDTTAEDTKKKESMKKPNEFSLVKSKEGFCSKLSRKQKKSENEKSFEKTSKAAEMGKDDVSTTTESEESSNQNKGSNKKRRKRKRHSSESEVIEKKMRKLRTESESYDSADDHKIFPNRKRAISESTCAVDEKKLCNKSSKSDEENEPTSIKKIKLQGDDVVSMKEKNETSGVQNEMELPENKIEKRKKRKRKKKDTEKLKLKVLSKAEWKHYKNKYLMMQKKTMSSVKKLLLLTKKQQAECEAMLSKSEEQASESLLKTAKDAMDTSHSEKEFQRGVIVKLSLNESVDVPSSLIKSIKSKVDVAFIDVCDKDKAFVRFVDPSVAAETLKNDLLKSFGTAQLVTGDEELAYWEKLEKDRIAHFNRPRTNKRGRDKILAKANALKKQSTHIYFDDSF